MATYSLRCRKNACRHRRVSTRHPDDLKIRVRCKGCGGFHGWRVESRDYNRRNLCNCDGPQLSQDMGKRFPHRTHNPYCEQNPWSEFNRAAVLGIPGGFLLGWRSDRRELSKPVLIDRRKRPTLAWSADDDMLFGGRLMHPDEPCPF